MSEYSKIGSSVRPFRFLLTSSSSAAAAASKTMINVRQSRERGRTLYFFRNRACTKHEIKTTIMRKNHTRTPQNDKMKEVALFLYEMLCIREGVLEFCHESNFLSRSQVDDIISFLACECLYIEHCTLHTAYQVHFIALLMFCYNLLCCT